MLSCHKYDDGRIPQVLLQLNLYCVVHVNADSGADGNLVLSDSINGGSSSSGRRTIWSTRKKVNF
jgi:hypothetical protein